MSISYPIIVDYDMGLKQAIEKGKYDLVEEIFSQENFPIERKGRGEIEMEFIHFNRFTTTKEVFEKLDRIGYRPVNIMELLAFGEKYSEVQREFTIVALGSACETKKGYYVPILHSFRSGRSLCTFGTMSIWHEDWRFAVVRK